MQPHIIHLKTVDSTNNELKKEKYRLEGTVILADKQTKGVGRFKRKWISSPGGLYFSILIKPKNLDNLGIVTFAASLSVMHAIRDIAKVKTRTKWPNDLFYRDKKICGILTESTLGQDSRLIVGIGLNTNNIVPNYAISLKKIIKQQIDNRKILERILYHFEKKMGKNKDSIISEFARNCFLMGQKIKVKTLKETIIGTVTDISQNCNLVLKNEKNQTIKITEGDIIF